MNDQFDTNDVHPRRLRAILFGDVVGYSRMMAVDELGTSTRIAQLFDRIEVVGAKHEGELASKNGDGLFFLFDSVLDAVRLGMEVQDLVNGESYAIPDDKKIQMRIGVHMGDVLRVIDQYVGDSVNIASRIESNARTGSVSISGAVYEQVRHKLNYGFEYVGRIELKNIPDPVDIYEISKDTQTVLMSASPRKADKEAPGAELRSLVASKPTIAVLPFTNLDNNDHDGFFADGVTEDLITNLSRFHALSIISRNSTFLYKNRDVSLTQVGEELRTQYIITGSIQKSNRRLRLTAELFNCQYGESVWRERYNREIEDIFDLQDEITDLITAAVAVQTQTSAKAEGRLQVPSLIATYSLVL
ncbi:MAG: adenylate cyclase, partial [Candidatus Azotimanducaceae bacterium]